MSESDSSGPRKSSSKLSTPMAKVNLARTPHPGSVSQSGLRRTPSGDVDLTTPALEPGSMVGDYRIEAKIGEGGMGTVYSAVHPVIGKKAAVKVMHRSLCLDQASVERFVREARAANQIGHPNIVDIFAFGKCTDGRSFLVMEWLSGETLRTCLDQKRLRPGDAVHILLQVCEALEAAHDKNIVHRDLKPDNIFLVPMRGKPLVVKLLDFGIAKLLGSPSSSPSQTQQGVWVGTPLYVAPEQARAQPTDYRADIYSLGVTAYEMFLGRLPFTGQSAIDVIHMHVTATPPRPSTVLPGIPAPLELLLCQMLEKPPDNRPTLQQVIARLRELQNMVGTLPAPSTRLSAEATPNAAAAPGSARPSTAPAPESPSRPSAAPPSEDPARAVPASGSAVSAKPIAPVSGAPATGRFAPSGRRRLYLVAGVVGAIGLGLGLLVLGPGARLPPTALTPAPAVEPASPPTASAALSPPAPAAPAARSAAVAPASVHVAVNVPAHIEIDGEPIADSAREATIAVTRFGSHTLAVTAAHRKPHRETVLASPGARINLSVTLERSAGAAHSKSRDDMLDPFAK